jgi:hypothetical protein
MSVTVVEICRSGWGPQFIININLNVDHHIWQNYLVPAQASKINSNISRLAKRYGDLDFCKGPIWTFPRVKSEGPKISLVELFPKEKDFFYFRIPLIFLFEF